MVVLLNITREIVGLARGFTRRIYSIYYVGVSIFLSARGEADPACALLRNERRALGEEPDWLQQLVRLLARGKLFLHVQIHPSNTIIYLRW